MILFYIPLITYAAIALVGILVRPIGTFTSPDTRTRSPESSRGEACEITHQPRRVLWLSWFGNRCPTLHLEPWTTKTLNLSQEGRLTCSCGFRRLPARGIQTYRAVEVLTAVLAVSWPSAGGLRPFICGHGRIGGQSAAVGCGLGMPAKP